MDLNILFENIGSIATSLERIADSLEQRGSVSATTATVEDKPKRTRRTKAEIAADEAPGVALESGEFTPAASIPAPVFAAPAPAPAPAPVVAAPVVAAPVVAAPVVAAPAPIGVTPAAANVDPAYLGFAVAHQFSELNRLVAPYFTTYGQVRDAVLGEAAKYGLSVPFSDEADRSQPGAAYRSVTNEARFAIYVAGANAIASLGGK